MKILGKNVNVFILMDDSPTTFVPFGCARTCVFTSNTVIAGVSTIGSGTFSEYKALSTNWNVSVSGLCTFDENAEIPDVRVLQKSLVQVYISFVQTAGSRTAYYSGYGILENITETGSYTDVETYDIQIQGSGEYAIDETAVYGNAPDDFSINTENPDTPSAGLTTLTFIWDEASPLPGSYTVEATNTSDGAVTLYDGIVDNDGWNFVAYTDNNYTFRIRSDYGGFAHSEWSATSVEWPDPPNDDSEYMEDSDGELMIDSDNQTMEDA